jgi:DNA-binding transcriptional LysR family regulator
MQPKQLQAFLLVMETGSVSAAATRLHVTQPTVSRLLSDLERASGLTLFDRKQGRIRPRQEAAQFRDEVEKVFLGANYLRRVAAALRENAGLRLRVGVFQAFSIRLLPALLAAFKPDYPEVGLSVAITTSSSLVEQVAAGAVDLAIVAGAVSHAGVETVARFSGECMCALPRRDPLASAEIVEIRELESKTIIWMDQRSEIAAALRRRLRPSVGSAAGTVEINLADAACRLVALGLGRAIIDPITADAISDPLVVLRRLRPAIEFKFSIIRPASLRLSGAGEAFIERMAAVCETLGRPSKAGSGPGRPVRQPRK